MKLKYYLRGLGIGILVTAVIMGVTQGSRKETLSDREIRERAAALGMVEPGNSLADMEAAATSETPEEVQTKAPSAEPSEEPSPVPSKEPSPVPSKEPAVTPSPAAEAKVTADETYTLEIQSGDSSYQVAYRLEQAGLVADARDFDNYLCSKGYDRKLRTGFYEIPEAATEAEIAEILGNR